MTTPADRTSTIGQYYVICNITKREILHPQSFRDGSKLLEFGCSQSGTLLALAILLSDTTECAGGDLALPDGPEYRSKWVKDKRFKSGERLVISKETRAPDPDGVWVGRWAGDKIVIPGDYGEHQKYIPKSAQNPPVKDWHWDSDGQAIVDGKPFPKEKLPQNLYGYACMHYTDISREMIRLLTRCNEGPDAVDGAMWKEVLDRIYLNRLDVEFRGAKTRPASDLTWLSVEEFAQLLHYAETPEQLNDLKLFLNKFKVHPFIKKWLLHYNVKDEVKASDQRMALRRTASGILDEGQKLLPPETILKAALYVVEAARGGARDPKKETPLVLAIAEAAGVTLRSRVVDLSED